VASAVAAFHARHEAFYGHSNAAAAVEFVNLRTVHLHRPDDRKPRVPAEPASGEPAPIGHRDAYFEDSVGFVRTSIYERRCLEAGHVITGPAIIEQTDTTLIVHPRQRASLRQDRSILVEFSDAF
jgi:N-methylhydantoinase A/oxoprolinase/acetone carboxylase beta subunit